MKILSVHNQDILKSLGIENIAIQHEQDLLDLVSKYREEGLILMVDAATYKQYESTLKQYNSDFDISILLFDGLDLEIGQRHLESIKADVLGFKQGGS